MIITMPADMAETLRRTVADGKYASISEFARKALCSRTRRCDTELRDLVMFRSAVKAGLNSGPGIPASQMLAGTDPSYGGKL